MGRAKFAQKEGSSQSDRAAVGQRNPTLRRLWRPQMMMMMMMMA